MSTHSIKLLCCGTVYNSGCSLCLSKEIYKLFSNVWFQKISIPPPQRVIGLSEGEEIIKDKIFIGKYEPKLEILMRWGAQTKNTLWGEGSMDIFWNNTINKICIQARPGVLGIRYLGCFQPRYSVFFCRNTGIKYFVFLNFWYSVYKRNVFFSFLKCLILSACVTFKKNDERSAVLA